MRIVVLNPGSKTIKAALVDVGEREVTVLERRVEELRDGRDVDFALSAALEGFSDGIDAVGHRVVHGGRRFTQPVRIDDEVQRVIEDHATLATVHNPLSLAGFRVARRQFSGRPMVAVFDTAFHFQRSRASRSYPLPSELCESLDLVRYGFHGIAYASLVESAAEALGSASEEVTAVALQLGAGSSACAIANGRSIETSMGLSPLGGLPMATRSGDLDPSVVLALVRSGRSVDEVQELLSERSGLAALAGSSDMREVLRAEQNGDSRAALALEVYVDRIVALVGAYFTRLGGRGALIFGGGVGANSAPIRQRVADGLAAWDVSLDRERNQANTRGRISLEGSRAVFAFETDEERIIARSVYALLAQGDNP